MKLHLPLITIAILLLASSCKVKQITSDANTAFDKQSYEQALSLYEEIIEMRESASRSASGRIYQNAGISAWETDQPQKAIDYLLKASKTDFADDNTFFTLAQAYRAIDNLSLELGALRSYVRDYPYGQNAIAANRRLFLALVESNNWDEAQKQWDRLDDISKQSPEPLTGNLKILRRQKDDNRVTVARQLLAIDEDNVEGLEVLAEALYQTAEDRYKREMKAYQDNRTNAQYRQLLAALEEVNRDFRRARDYYLKLYNMNSRPRYAFYLGNIYTRFDNKEKAEYYHERAKGNQMQGQ